MTDGSHCEIQLENEHFRVARWTIEPGGAIPMHRHEHEYVVVPMVTNAMHVTNADGTETVSELVAGCSYTRPEGSEHRIEHRGTGEPIVFIEIERLA